MLYVLIEVVNYVVYLRDGVVLFIEMFMSMIFMIKNVMILCCVFGFMGIISSSWGLFMVIYLRI